MCALVNLWSGFSMSETKTDAMAEITAMKSVAEALANLDPASIKRVLQWAGGRFGVSPGKNGGSTLGAEEPHEGPERKFGTFADLYDAAAPQSDADKALVAGYWFQFVEGQEDFAS